MSKRKNPSMAKNLEQLVEKRFDDSSVCTTESPTFVLVMGAIAVGKTDVRRKKYSSGFVVVDAAEIFLDLCDGVYHDFPSIFEEPVNVIGEAIATRAVAENRNMVCEVVGDDSAQIAPLIEALKQIGYRASLESISCDLEESLRRNENRGENDISSYYTQEFHVRWLFTALREQSQDLVLH